MYRCPFCNVSMDIDAKYCSVCGNMVEVASYTLIGRLGGGGIAKVFLRQHKLLKRRAAMKVIGVVYIAA